LYFEISEISRFAFGFAGCLTADIEGKYPLGHSATSRGGIHDAMSIKPFLEFLVESLERHQQLENIREKFK
jgi:hypothetical protein